MIRPGRNYPNLHSVVFIPTSILINHKNSLLNLQKVNRSLSIERIGRLLNWNIDFSPMYQVSCFIVAHNTFVIWGATRSATTRAAECSCVSNCCRKHSRIAAVKMLWHHSILVKFTHWWVMHDLWMSNSKLVYKVLALFGQGTESSLGNSVLEGSF